MLKKDQQWKELLSPFWRKIKPGRGWAGWACLSRGETGSPQILDLSQKE
jgi:hypothetical protein